MKVKYCNWLGSTALHSAAKYGQKASIDFLVKKGANIHEKDDSGKNIVDLYLYNLYT